MCVGVQREACGEMPQHSGNGFHIHTVLQCQRGEGVPQILYGGVVRFREKNPDWQGGLVHSIHIFLMAPYCLPQNSIS